MRKYQITIIFIIYFVCCWHSKQVYAVSANSTMTVKAIKTHVLYDQDKQKIKTIRKGTIVSLQHQANKAPYIIVGKQKGIANPSNYRHVTAINGLQQITYHQYVSMLQVFEDMYPNAVQLKQIGTSVDNRAIYAYRLGKGKKEIYIDASTHAREHMTTNVVMKMIDTYTKAYVRGTTINGENIRKILNETSIWFVPMVNPDGVTLVQHGLKSVSTTYRNQVLAANGGSRDFQRYKANIRGVDLNRNYPAGWQSFNSVKTPNYQHYKGKTASSEPETVALIQFVKQHQFKTYITYHSSGQVLYWRYGQPKKREIRDRQVMQVIQRATGYQPVNDSGISNGSGAGQDWFVAHMKQSGITVEIAPAVGPKPVPTRYWSSVWRKNKMVGIFAAKEAMKR